MSNPQQRQRPIGTDSVKQVRLCSMFLTPACLPDLVSDVHLCISARACRRAWADTEPSVQEKLEAQVSSCSR